jgi:hypothetical protein
MNIESLAFCYNPYTTPKILLLDFIIEHSKITPDQPVYC